MIKCESLYTQQQIAQCTYVVCMRNVYVPCGTLGIGEVFKYTQNMVLHIHATYIHMHTELSVVVYIT